MTLVPGTWVTLPALRICPLDFTAFALGFRVPWTGFTTASPLAERHWSDAPIGALAADLSEDQIGKANAQGKMPGRNGTQLRRGIVVFEPPRRPIVLCRRKRSRSAGLRARSTPQTHATPNSPCLHRSIVPEALVVPLFCLQPHPLRGSDLLRTQEVRAPEIFPPATLHSAMPALN